VAEEVIGGYRLLKHMVTGQTSQVWEVVESASNRHFAMKLLLPERARDPVHRRFLMHEAMVGKQLAHPNIIKIMCVVKDDKNPSLFCLSEGDRSHAVCQVSRVMMSKYPTPTLRARFTTLSPVYELGIADIAQYAQIMVALFSGIVWLSRDSLSGSHIRFFLKSPGDAQFFAALRVESPLSPFSVFTIDGSLIECSMRESDSAEEDEMAKAMA